MQIGPAVYSYNVADKETKKSPENNTPSPYWGRGNKTFAKYLQKRFILHVTMV